MAHEHTNGLNQETPLITEQQLFSYIQSEVKKSGIALDFAGICVSWRK